jgi:hypothetical protein
MTKAPQPARKAPKPKPEEEWPKKTPPSEYQTAEMANVNERRRSRRPAVPMDARKKADGSLVVSATTTDEKLAYERLMDVFGTRSEAWMDGVVSQLSSVAGGTKDPGAEATLKQGIAFLNGLGPRDELEAALGAQMFAMHRMTMSAANRAAGAETRDGYRDYCNIAVKAARTFSAQIEALTKLRSGGKQQVEVRYIYVDARGGQNVIASPIAPGGGAVGDGNRRQSHAPVPGLAFAPGVPVWSPDPEGDALPVTSASRAEALPDAWRESGGTDGLGERPLSHGPVHKGGEGGLEADAGACAAGKGGTQ